MLFKFGVKFLQKKPAFHHFVNKSRQKLCDAKFRQNKTGLEVIRKSKKIFFNFKKEIIKS